MGRRSGALNGAPDAVLIWSSCETRREVPGSFSFAAELFYCSPLTPMVNRVLTSRPLCSTEGGVPNAAVHADVHEPCQCRTRACPPPSEARHAFSFCPFDGADW